MKKPFLLISVLVACGYLLLSVAPMACAIDSGDRHAAGHHHGGKLSHSGSCAWACQANPGSSVISSGLPLKPLSEILALHWTQDVFTPSLPDHSPVSRGPPPAFLPA